MKIITEAFLLLSPSCIRGQAGSSPYRKDLFMFLVQSQASHSILKACHLGKLLHCQQHWERDLKKHQKCITSALCYYFALLSNKCGFTAGQVTPAVFVMILFSLLPVTVTPSFLTLCRTTSAHKSGRRPLLCPSHWLKKPKQNRNPLSASLNLLHKGPYEGCAREDIELWR